MRCAVADMAGRVPFLKWIRAHTLGDTGGCHRVRAG